MNKSISILLPILLGAFISGCDTNCCEEVTKDNHTDPQPAPIQNHPPVARINGQRVGDILCQPGSDLILKDDKSSDIDNNLDLSKSVWDTADGTPNITCPVSGESIRVCLTVEDSEGLTDKVCRDIVARDYTRTKIPSATIIPNGDTGDGQFLSCQNVHDNDIYHTYPGTYLYGSNNPKDISEVVWKYTYYNTDGTKSGPYEKTQSSYNKQNNKEPGVCEKWFHTTGVDYIELEVTALDDDKETNTTKYTFDVATKTLTPKP